jgi:hypothetical protein
MENVVPSKWEKVPIGLFKTLVKVRDAEAESHQIVVLVDHKISIFEVDEGKILLDIAIYLFVGEGDKIVKIFERLVDGEEELAGVGHNLLTFFETEELEMIFIEDELVDSPYFLRYGL